MVVLGLPRGGVPVAREVAAALGAPLDVIAVRKLGVPFDPEFAMGAIGEDGVRVLDEHTIDDVPVPCRGNVVLCAEGTLMRWSRRLQGAEIIAGIPCQAGSVATFYASGKPERLTVGSDVEIGGVVALAGTDIEFHENGRVSVVTVAEPCERGGIHVEDGTPLIFREDGTLSVVHLVDDLDVNGVIYTAGTYLNFDESEQLASHVTISWSVGSHARAERV